MFFIPCDSHKLQLLVKDFFCLESLLVIFNQALKMVNFFCKAKHHLRIFCKHQQAVYGKKCALIASIILRWRIQIDLLESVAQSKQAL